EPPVKTGNVEQEFRGATPITLYAEFDCSLVGVTDAERVASDALAQVEARELEAVFWTGRAGGQQTAYPYLAGDALLVDDQDIVLQSAASPVVTGVDVVRGLGELEQELADCYAGQGVIHVP